MAPRSRSTPGPQTAAPASSPLRLGATGLHGSAGGRAQRLLVFADSVLRGVGQVMFQDNSYAGLLFLVGVALNSPLLALATVVGAAVGTLTAMALGADRALLRAGMWGFNGALVALALLTFLRPSALTWACTVLACAASTVLMAAAQVFLRRWRLPALTAPFVFTTLCMFLATARLGRLEPTGLLPTASLPQAATVQGVVDAATLAQGLFAGIAQVFFQGQVWTGVIFAAGLLLASRRACAAALAGSAAGLLVAWAMGAAEPAIRAGMFGFNSVLVAVALAGVFLTPGRAGFAWALFGAVLTPFVAAAATAALAPLGIPALTLPFLLVTWVLLLAGRALPGSRRRTRASVGET